MIEHAAYFWERECRVLVTQAVQHNDAQVVDAHRDFEKCGIDTHLFAPELAEIALSETEGGNVQAQVTRLVEGDGNEGNDRIFHGIPTRMRRYEQ
jgi:hypothetical protein